MPTPTAAQRLDAAITARNKLTTTNPIPVIPHFHSALSAFENLQSHEAKHSNQRRVNIPLLDDWKYPYSKLQEPVVYRFLRSLPRVGLRRIPLDGSQECMICRQAFSSVGGSEAVMATKMPCCSQFVCVSCMALWLQPFQAAAKNRCVHCRAVLFQGLPDQDTVEGLEARDEIVRWAKGKLGVRFKNARDQEVVRSIKVSLLFHRLESALAETRRHLLKAGQLDGGDKVDQKSMPVDAKRQFALQELWLRQATVQYLAIQLHAKLPDRSEGLREDLERGLLKTLAHLGRFLAYANGEGG